MKKLMIVVSMLSCLCCSADEAAAPSEGVKTPHKRGEWRLRRTGGIVRKAGSAQGKVVFLNAQQRVPTASLKPAVNEIEQRIHPILEIRDVPSVKTDAVGGAVNAAGARLGVVIVDDPNGPPALLTAPEEGWAVVNVAKLAVDSPAPEVLASRVRKELLRAFAFIGGGAFLSLDPIVMRADVRTATDLDLIKQEMYGIDVCRGIEMNLPHAGVTPWKVASYRVACQEGWAEAPTNEFQKAIWKQTHEIPANPLTIKRNVKKDK